MKKILLNLILVFFWLIDMAIVSLTCQNQSCVSKLISEWKPYVLCQLNHNLIITYHYTEKVITQIHNIMILIFITCAVINHLFFTLWSTSVMHFLMKSK